MNPNTFVLTTLLVTGAALLAQEPATHALPAGALTSLRDATALVPDGDGFRAGGFDWEATLDRRGLHFVPALGLRAPNTQHLALRPNSVLRADGTTTAIDPAAQPHFANNHRVAFARSAGIGERYDVTSAGLALSWEFAARPAGHGDLIVRYDLDTSMPAGPAPAGELAFHLPTIGGVGIGAVTGVDASGRKMAGELRLQGRMLELRLPGTFVDEAAYPMVLDPLIGTQFLAETGGWNDSASDVAYDVTNNVWLVVYRRVFSGTSMAIRGQRISATGTLVGSFFGLADGPNLNHPTVANLNARDTFVVAWQQAASVWDLADIVCRSVNAATGATSVTTTLGSATANEIHPDAAGDNTTSDDEAMVAYELTGGGIRIASLTVAAAGAQPVLQGTTVVTSVTTARNPALSKSQPSTNAYVCVFSDTSGATGRIRARALDRNGILLGTEISVTSGATTGPGTADVDGNGSEFLVVYDFLEAGATNGQRDVWCRGLTWSGATLTPSASITGVQTTATTDQTDPVVALCRYKYLVLWADQFLPGSANYDLRGAELAADCARCGNPIHLTGLNGTALRNLEWKPAVASEYGGGGADDDALLTFSEADDAPPFTSSVIAQRYEALGPGGAITTLGTTCGAGGTIGTAGGPFAVGNTDFRVTASGLPAGSVPFLLIGFPGGEIPCGPCLYVNSIAIETPVVSGSTAYYAWRLRCAYYSVLGTNYQVQWAVFSTPTTPCPTLPGLAFSQRLRMTVGL